MDGGSSLMRMAESDLWMQTGSVQGNGLKMLDVCKRDDIDFWLGA